jgi:hypothetical protein
MEVEGIRRLIIRWRSDGLVDAKVAGYAHERHSKIRKFIADL